jgi:hypothetical protein
MDREELTTHFHQVLRLKEWRFIKYSFSWRAAYTQGQLYLSPSLLKVLPLSVAHAGVAKNYKLEV